MPTVRWRDWDGGSIEHLVLTETGRGFVAHSAYIASPEDGYAVTYRVEIDAEWRSRSLALDMIGESRSLSLRADGSGHWTGGDGAALPELDGAFEIDMIITPFTNTLPIRRLNLAVGDSAEIVTAYVDFPSLRVFPDPQRYTRLGPNRYQFESLDSDFVREIDVDEHGLVVLYPDLFKRG